MEKKLNKVQYSEYEGKYDASIKEGLKKDPLSVDVETMRENLYGYTFTEDYAKGVIPDELSMDYWEELHLDDDINLLDDLDHLLEDETDSPYFDVSPQEELILKTIDSTGDGKTPETALCVIDVHQEYEYIARVVRFFALRLVRQSVKNGIDSLEFKNYKGEIEKVYFDITRRFEVG